VNIGSRALDILIALITRPGELVTKRELMSIVWPDTVVVEANLTVNIVALRRALRDGQNGNRYVQIFPGEAKLRGACRIRRRNQIVRTADESACGRRGGDSC
jgi:hypothetical protein